MKLTKKKFFIFLFVLISIQSIKIESAFKPKFNFFTVSLPKCGTHLVQKFFKLCANKTGRWSGEHENNFLIQTDVIDSLRKNEYYITHAPAIKENLELLNNYNIKGIHIVRDPRDQLISSVFWIYKNHPEKVKDLTTDMLITKLLEDYCFLSLPREIFKDVKTITQAYELYFPWSNNKKIYTTKFENLVGPQGGGTKEAQSTEITNICKHLGIAVTTAQMEDICQQLFGGTGTFRKGESGSWKEHFTSEHKILFKKIAGNLLIKLGYEKDLNW